MDNVAKWKSTILDDEFDDRKQNKARRNKIASGELVLNQLIALAPVADPSLNIGCGCGDDNDFTYLLDPSPSRKAQGKAGKIKNGWMENLPMKDKTLEYILCWGTFCFLRSPVEALMEANRVLQKGGCFIFDIVNYTTLPLAQTTNRESFLRWLVLFGFEVQAWIEFGWIYHQRTGIRAIKTSDFNPARFRFPQANGRGEINNYLPERDWYMQ